MSKIKLEAPFQSFRGKVCKHSEIIFKQMYGTRFTSQICNPYTGAPSQAQTAQRTKMSQAAAAVKALSQTDRNNYLTEFKKQTRYRSFYGFLMAQEFAKLS